MGKRLGFGVLCTLILSGSAFGAESLRVVVVQKLWEQEVDKVKFEVTVAGKQHEVSTSGTLSVKVLDEVNDSQPDIDTTEKVYEKKYCNEIFEGPLKVLAHQIEGMSGLGTGRYLPLQPNYRVTPTELQLTYLLKGKTSVRYKTIQCGVKR